MKKVFLFCLPLVLLCSCFTRRTVMTEQAFSDIQIGSTITEVEKDAGRPYAIHRKSSSEEVYEYIERIDLGQNLIYENHYYINVIDGIVVGKRYSQERPPSYDAIYCDDPNVFNCY